MIGFLIRKSFWDFWDRMGVMILINAGFLLLGVGGSYLVSLTTDWRWFFYISLFVLFLLISLYIGMSSAIIHDMVYNKSFSWSRFPSALKENALRSLLIAVAVLVMFFIFRNAYEFYMVQVQSIVSMGAFFILFWVSVFLIMAAQWYFPLYNLMKNPLKKHLKKCYILTLDNTGLSLFMLIWSLILFLLSFLLIFLTPGIAALLILNHNALKLVMYKYDYLEENPSANRRKIPWRILLKDEMDKLGKRGLSYIIRPHKLD